MTIEDCLPAELKGPNTTITRIVAGLSGAGVYRVESAGQAYVLKVAAENESAADWQATLHVEQLAADAGLTPRIVHVDADKRAVVSDFVADRSLPAFYLNPQTHEAALTLLGQTVRRIHALPIPDDARRRQPREFLSQVFGGILAGFALPAFARQTIEHVLAAEPPVSQRALVLGHNDLNPSNLVYDGRAILVLDWAAAGVADPFYDLAVLSVFLRMDASNSLRLLSAYDGTSRVELPSAFLYFRRMAATLAGTMGLYLAQRLQHPGATGEETLESTLPLGEFYQRMRAGTLKLGTPAGQWAFGLALLKEGQTL